MNETERLLNGFAVTIREARVDSELPDGITLSFHLAPSPVPLQWRYLFTNLTSGNRGSVMSTTSPLFHGDDIVWKVVEGDIPNAKHFVEGRVSQANALFTRWLVDKAQIRVLEHVTTSEAEIERLQRILDEA
jgi:hypothetical protein